jgi:hypothetical protein
MEKILFIILSTITTIVMIDNIRECYIQKEWFLFAFVAFLLIADIALIMLFWG